MPGAGGPRGRRVLAGSVFGVRSAAFYAAVECAALALAPAAGLSLLPAPHLAPGALALWFGAYAALGAGVGAVLGACFRSGLPALATLVLVVGHAGHLVRVSLPSSALALALAVCALAAAALLLGARAERPSSALDCLIHPGSVSLLVIGASVLLLEPGAAPLSTQIGVTCAWTAAVTGLSLGLGWAGRRFVRAPGPLGGLAAGAAALAAAAGLVLWLQRPRPPALPPAPSAPAEGPDIVLITLDTVRSDHLSVYGYARDTTPNLEDFARGATLYTRAVAASNLTLPTHASLFTGLYARHHGAHVDAQLGAMGLAERFRTLAEVLHEAGYLTLAVVGNPGYLAARLGFAQGFDVYDEAAPEPFFPALRPELAAASLLAALDAVLGDPPDVVRAESSYRSADEINRVVFTFLDALAGRRQPVFLFVNYMDAHWPYDPPPPFDTRYPGRLPEGARPGRATFRAAHYLQRKLTPAERRHMVSQYDGEIAYLDSALGRFFEHLRALGRWDRALVVVTSDHGEALGEHGLLAHGISLHEQQVHVPLLIKLPGQREAAVSDALASSIDVMPTLLAAAGLEVPGALPGLDLRGSAPPGRVVFSESYPGLVLSRSKSRFGDTQRAVFSGALKLMVFDSGRRELFDLAADPQETHDLHTSDPRGARLERELGAWLGARPAEAGAAGELDAATRARLEALGYGH